ncbi:hypothetical protein IKU74_04605 [bacterium]|nr:hypothetical protein [bacterium]
MSTQLAIQYEENEQFEQALEEYKKIYEHNQKDLSVIERLAHLSMMVGQKEEAAGYYMKMLEFDATNTMVYEQLMDIYIDTDKFKYYINRGNLHSVQQQYEHAANDYKKAVQNTDDEKQIINTRFVLASVYVQLGQNTKAIDEYMRLLDYDEIPVPTYLNLAKLYINEDAIGSAINVLERAYSKNIDVEHIRENLAGLYLRDGQLDKALETTQDNLTKAKCLLEKEDADEAYKLLESADDNAKNTAKYHSLLSQYYYVKKDFDKALLEVEEFRKCDSKSPLAYQMAAIIFEEMNDDFNAHLNWGRYNLVRGNKDIAINEFLNAVQINNDDVNLLVSLAMLLEESGDKNHAMEYYDRVAQLEPNNPSALAKLADFRASIGDYQTEVDYLEKWYEVDKRNYELIKRIAQSYERIKNKPSAVEYYQKYLQVASTAQDYEKIKAHLAKLENTEMAEEEGLIDKFMRFFNKDK